MLTKVADKPACAARIGGDEFVLLLPGVDERGAEQMLERVQELITLNNTFYPGATLSLAMGCATARQGERLEATVTQADEQMMRVKREFYASSGFDRRASQHGHLG